MSTGFNIRMENATLGYGTKALIENASMYLEEGKIISVFGKNGSGKTTFIKSLMSLLPILEGVIEIGGNSVSNMSQKQKAKMMSVVFSNRPSIANMKVHDYVMYGRYPYTNWLGVNSGNDLELVNAVIDDCGISNLSDRLINELSDGEMQKVQIARALTQNTPILLLDEPVSHLDLANKAEIFNLLKMINRKEGKTIIFSSHDLQFSLQLATDFIVIDENRAESMPTQRFLNEKRYEKIMQSNFLDFDPKNNVLKYKSN